MKEDNISRLSICPRCGKPYYEPPALSRLDNETLICPDCGTQGTGAGQHWRFA